MIQGVVEKKSTIPILSNLLLEAKGGELSIKATDLDVSITTGCEAEIRTEGSLCICLLYTSDAADERSSVDLGGRRIFKKKKTNEKAT